MHPSFPILSISPPVVRRKSRQEVRVRRQTDHRSTFHSSTAVGLRVANVRRAADFYQRLGFTFVMAVADDNDDWRLCLLKYGSASILLRPLDYLQFPGANTRRGLPSAPRGFGVRIDLAVRDIAATYEACRATGGKVTEEPTQELWGDFTFSCLDPFGYEWRFTQAAERRTLDRITSAAKAVWS
jgi:uncharacterized glyoxalase superfamily protein PhnB